MSLLHVAHVGSTPRCRQLLAAGDDVEQRDPTSLAKPIHVAALFGHEEIIQLLLSHRANVNSRDRIDSTPLYYASQEGHFASVMTLLHAGADTLLPDIYGSLPIHKAAERNHSEVVRILIKKGGCSPDQV